MLYLDDSSRFTETAPRKAKSTWVSNCSQISLNNILGTEVVAKTWKYYKR